jgi:hypothetical protein
MNDVWKWVFLAAMVVIVAKQLFEGEIVTNRLHRRVNRIEQPGLFWLLITLQLAIVFYILGMTVYPYLAKGTKLVK